MLILGLCFLSWEANSLSRTCLHKTTQLSQMYTPGPAMSFLTSACDLPQKLQSVMLVGRATVIFDLRFSIYDLKFVRSYSFLSIKLVARSARFGISFRDFTTSSTRP